jgi:hypothetical protein
VPALIVLAVDAAGAICFGLTYSALLGYLVITSSETELADTYPSGGRVAALMLLLTLAIAVAGLVAAVVAVRLGRDRTRRLGATVVLGAVTVVTAVAAFTAHGGFDGSRSPRWLLIAAVHGGALAVLRWRGGSTAPDP